MRGRSLEVFNATYGKDPYDTYDILRNDFTTCRCGRNMRLRWNERLGVYFWECPRWGSFLFWFLLRHEHELHATGIRQRFLFDV